MPRLASVRILRRTACLALAIVALAASPSGFGRDAIAQEIALRASAPGNAQLFIFLYRPGPAWRAGVPMDQQGLRPHGAYMRGLMEGGRLFAAGGFVEAEGGMALVRAASMEEASAMLAADPAVTAGIFTGEIQRWRPRFRTDDPLPAAD